MKVAVIPARGGSKRIPGKNVKDFRGKPMIAWSIDAARESGCFDRILVSTDDEEIAALARSAGAEAPFSRPAHLSGDHVPTAPVIRHAIEWLSGTGATPTLACCIYATAPFLRAADIAQGLELLLSSGASYAFTVASYPAPVQRALKIDGDGRLAMLQPEFRETRSQDLEQAYLDAGQFYWGRAEAWLAEVPIFSAGSVPVLLARERVQDIDTPEDWAQAELLHEALERRGARR